MNSVRFALLLVGMGVIHPVAQAQWRLLYGSEDIMATPADTTVKITSIESRGIFSKYLVVRSANRKKVLVPKKSVWGYMDADNRVWRSYDKDSYLLVKYNEGWVEYVVNRCVSSSSLRTFMQPMYSRTLDSRIYTTWQAAMKDVPPRFILR